MKKAFRPFPSSLFPAQDRRTMSGFYTQTDSKKYPPNYSMGV